MLASETLHGLHFDPGVHDLKKTWVERQRFVFPPPDNFAKELPYGGRQYRFANPDKHGASRRFTGEVVTFCEIRAVITPERDVIALLRCVFENWPCDDAFGNHE